MRGAGCGALLVGAECCLWGAGAVSGCKALFAGCRALIAGCEI